MKIIIAGNGKIGSSLAGLLVGEGHDITIIDSNPKVLETTLERYDVMAVQGNCATMDTLVQAGIKDAELLIAVTGEDELNLLCCLTGHGINRKLHTIARIRNPEYADQLFHLRNTFALSMIINPEKAAAREIERLLKLPGFLKRDTFAKGRVEIVELKVTQECGLAGCSLIQMSNKIKCKVLVCAVVRNGEVIMPDGSFVFEEGDRIFVTATTNNLSVLLNSLGIYAHKTKRVLICGGSRIAYYLAKQLEKSGITVRLIEKDDKKCLSLAEQLPRTEIIQGDACSRALLESEGLLDSDALVTLTGIDELNVIISMFGREQKVPQIITKVAHADLFSLSESLSIGSLVNPRELCCNTIVRYVRAMQNQTGAALSVHSIADGHAEAMEFIVDDTAMNCGIPLKELRLRKNILLACITHGSQQYIPDGDSSFGIGDTVIIVTGSHQKIHKLNDIFE